MGVLKDGNFKKNAIKNLKILNKSIRLIIGQEQQLLKN